MTVRFFVHRVTIGRNRFVIPHSTMPSIISTQETALKFTFSKENRLYTDHKGRRVIADVEGIGMIRILHSDPPLQLIGPHDEVELFDATFLNGAIVLANGPGDVCIEILLGRTELVTGTSVVVENAYDGCGWVVHSDGEMQIDHRQDIAPKASADFPVPFFTKVQTQSVVKIIKAAGVHCIKIDSFDISDTISLKSRNFKVQGMSALISLSGSFPDGTSHVGLVASHLNVATFSVVIPPNCNGLILRKTFDQFHGRQRARVLVNDKFVGWWYLPAEDRNHRWKTSDFGIDGAALNGLTEVVISIDPVAGSALWSVSKMEIFALVPEIAA